nr:TonB-dependent receptor [Brevundimonas lenta]
MPVETAFEQILGPAGARAVRLGDRAYRIETAPPPPVRRAPAVAAPVEPTELESVVVTAPVRRGGIDGANGASPIDSAALERAEGRPASDAVADLTATVDSTRQGPGRNKLFIRGVADSAFNGSMQATVGQYFGDLRLTYGTPDPDLTLVDVRRIDVFEGPQSSRFGSGSIGGIVRMEPAPAEPGETSTWMSTGLSATSGGAPGGDVALVMNRPLGDAAGARLVLYGRRDGGFLENPVRGVSQADAVETVGARAAVRWSGEAWTVDTVALAQGISARDAQTVNTTAKGLDKTRRVAEPYDSDLALVGLVASRRSSGMRFTSATSISRQVLEERFDATSPSNPTPAAVDRRQTVVALSSEARWELYGEGLWSLNGGAALAAGETRSIRARKVLIGDVPPEAQVDVRRQFAEGALFGELVAAPADDWRFAIGGRLSMVRAVHEARSVGFGQDLARSRPPRTEAHLSPTFAARWTSPSGAQVFARLEQGVRPGSVSETRGSLERYRSDRVTLLEAGVRTPDGDRDWTLEASAGQLDWRNIQADTITQGGDLVTANIGDGFVRFVQARGSWFPNEAFSLSGGVFLNDSEVTLAGPNVIGVEGGPIPNVARAGAQMSVDYVYGRVAGLPLRLGGDVRYVGESRPGLGPGLDVAQGDYVLMDLAARLGDERAAWSLRISNPFDAGGIRYGVGSPYQLSEPQGAPLRPMTVRLGFEAAF